MTSLHDATLKARSQPLPQGLPPALRLFALVSVSLAAACVATELFCSLVLHLPDPYSWPLTPFHELHYDLTLFELRFQRFHQLDFFDMEPDRAFAYPAPIAVLYRLLYFLPFQTRTNLFLVLLVVLFLGFAYLVCRALIRNGLSPRAASTFCGSVVLLSYPMAFEAKQGNLELFVCVLVSAGVWLFLRGRQYSAAACLAMAGAMKIFPIIFFGLLLAQRRWKPIIFGLIFAVAITLASLWLLAPDVAYTWRHLQDGIALFQQKIVLQVVQREIGFDHSLFSLVKRIWLLAKPLSTLPGVLRIYMYMVALAGSGIYFLRIRHMPVLNQVLALTLCVILLPPVSYDYTLINLYAPLALLALLAVENRERAPVLTGVFVLLAVALAPLSEIIVHGSRIGGQVRALDLLTLLALTLMRPFPSHFDTAQPA